MAKILIVDDSLFIRGHLARLLIKHGHEIVTADDGVKAVRVYEQANPDLVIMDITMPQKNGLEALADIRRFDPTARVIMLTALDQPAAATMSIQLGAKDFLPKPIDQEKLLSVLKRVLK
ncbi:MAG: response regulator [Anaerolineae bacterium]|nr:response regulator [Anaerolineae bacterium]